MSACKLCGLPECDCMQKNLDEELLGKPNDPVEPEPTEPVVVPPVEPVVDEPTEPVGKPEKDWKELAAAEGWVPDHVREKHAREAQTLRDQVANLQKIVNAAQRYEPERDPNEGVTRGELDQELAALQDKAILSEKLIRFEVEDYDATVSEHLVPLARKNPWLEEYLYNRPNPAKEAYKFACALRDGKKIEAEFGPNGLVFNVVEPVVDTPTPAPTPKDPSRPDPKALEQALKQPKSIDSVPAAKSSEAVSMSVEDFWNLPSDTLLRIRAKNPEMYEKMRSDFRAKYGE